MFDKNMNFSIKCAKLVLNPGHVQVKNNIRVKTNHHSILI